MFVNSHSQKYDHIIKFYKDQQQQFLLEQFISQVRIFFEKNPRLNKPPLPIIHSLKSRIKDPEHLRDKLLRKNKEIAPADLFSHVTDLAGVRVLHLYQDQFPDIHSAVEDKISSGEWQFVENPKAYTWDPECTDFYKNLNIECQIKDSFYTSVHYVVKPNNTNFVCCEIQVRTLFEEIWGEIDHAINYPHETENIACREQLRVLSKLVSTGTRLSDSIFRTHASQLK